MPKPSVALAAVLLAATVGFLTFHPTAARDLTNWTRRQLGMGAPKMKDVGSPNYMPVVPGKGL